MIRYTTKKCLGCKYCSVESGNCPATPVAAKADELALLRLTAAVYRDMLKSCLKLHKKGLHDKALNELYDYTEVPIAELMENLGGMTIEKQSNYALKAINGDLKVTSSGASVVTMI